ncbi:MAG: hypothetical protein EOM87_08390 [Clostridia bacterium]|nr:hypothetical protein [Clostridia bacterium]
MSYSVDTINSESSSARLQQAQQEKILQMQQSKEAKIQQNGTKVEDSKALAASENITDTIEISDEGKMALEQIKAAKADSKDIVIAPKTELTETTETTETASANSETTSTESAVSELIDEEDDVTASDLYTMTESELLSLVSNRTITRKEMQVELQRRNEFA